ncbi:MAG: holo-[acyl-carrier-protein] synthase [Armatimonadetes bacterium 13_1_40CM_3_65_7]|nr:MAG: holo-[acyl-carrier-protein] synthase [Armatimonadetes bacterium 13_1_40CM_3_65_7]
MTSIKGVGIDVVEVRRIEQALDRWGDAFVTRIFTVAEDERAKPPHARSARLAARFAAKEAVMKALGLGWRAMGWREIEILNDPLGKPTVTLRGGAQRAAERQGIAAIHVSLSHTRALAFASALAISHPSAR